MTMHGKHGIWKEREYNILIGSSSETIELREHLKVNEDPRSMAPLFNRMSPIKQFLQYPKTRELVANTFAESPRAALFLGDDEMFTSMPIAQNGCPGHPHR